METVRIGFAGLGSRGPWAVNRYCHIPGVQIVALCDYEEGRARDARLVYCLQNGLPLDIDVYDLAEWCALAELGALSMDNGCAAVSFPDFTRGEWNEQQGFRHAYASPEDESAAEKAARESTARQQELAAKKKLWEKYDKKYGQK